MPNYAYLKTDLINTTENDSTEFSTQVSVFVRKAEERLAYSLDDFGLDEFNTVSVSSANALLQVQVVPELIYFLAR